MIYRLAICLVNALSRPKEIKVEVASNAAWRVTLPEDVLHQGLKNIF